MRILSRCAVSLILFGLIPACKNERNPEGAGILKKSAWRASSFDFDPTTNPSGNSAYYPWQECQLSYRIAFGDNGVFSVTEGEKKCDESSTGLFKPGTYTYRYDETSLWIEDTELKIAVLSKGRLKLYTVVPSATGFQSVIFLFELY